MTHKETVLKNGLKVVSSRMGHMESVSLGVWIGVGGRYETAKNNGISHLVEHLLFKGTKKRDATKLKNDIEGRGASFNGFTAEEFTCYLVKVLGKDMDLGVDVLSDMALNALLAPEDMEKEKRVILEEINMYKDQPSHYVHELLTAILWPDQPLGLPLAGTVESVSSIGRRDVVKFRDDHYHAGNIIVSGAGNLNHEELVRLASKYLPGKGARAGSRFERAVKRQRKPGLALETRKTEQTHLAIGIHAFDRFHKDKYVLSLINVILGANMSSRLFQEVRERLALCYEIGTEVRRYNDAGAFVIHAGVEGEKIGKTLEIVFRELKKMKRLPVGKDEFGRAKEYFRGQLLLALEGTMSGMLWLGEKILTGEGDLDPRRILEKVERITPEDVERVSDALFRDENLNLAVIGPVKEKGMLEEALHIP